MRDVLSQQKLYIEKKQKEGSKIYLRHGQRKKHDYFLSPSPISKYEANLFH